jgi:hypothetical protein
MTLKLRALSPPTNPNSTPGEPSGGESSKLALTGPPVSSTCPVRPASRQNGVSYIAATLVRVPCG